MEIIRAIRENAGEPGYAWRILTQGVCDGCALGTSGLRDWTLDGIHLCNIRLRLLKLNTMPPLNPNRLADVTRLLSLSSGELRDLGRLPYPMLRTPGSKGFTRISWDDALNLAAEHIRATSTEKTAYYLTSRGMPNESYYCAQKAVRAMGSNNIDNAARVCHAPSTVALKDSIGVAASTCSYADWLKTDLMLFIGSNIANNQPVATKYLHFAKKNGTKIFSINTYREPGMERYWIPSVPESALFGTRLTDRFFLINTGGDAAFLSGVLKHLIETDGVNQQFIAAHTIGFDAVRQQLEHLDWSSLESASGTSRSEMCALAQALRPAKRVIFVWSMGVTQHCHGEDNVRSIVNLALAGGWIGRSGCGLVPIRGHSGVQGGAEMGAYATAFPGGLPITHENAEKLANLWGFSVPGTRGMHAGEIMDAAHAGQLDVLFSCGGNFLEVLPDPAYVDHALARIPLRIHMDLVLTRQMLTPSDGAVLLLPAATRYETPGGVTETSTERRVIFSPEIPGRRIGEARPEWEVFLDLARRVRPDLANRLYFPDTAAVRAEIARVVPLYDGIQHLRKAGDQFQYGGPHLCVDGAFPLPDGKARFAPPAIPQIAPREPSRFCLATRRGKQFNSMVHETSDTITGAARDAVFISAADAGRLGLRPGDRVLLRNEFGTLEGRVFIAEITPGNLQIHWPEGNVLLDRTRRSSASGVPDYNTLVTLESL
jgi:molybdopterin-dependent oxidoreductase alpha subunit